MSATPRPAPSSADSLGRVGSAFLVLDAAERCTHASADAAALLGLTPGTLVGRTLASLLPTAGALHAAVAKAAATQQPQR